MSQLPSGIVEISGHILAIRSGRRHTFMDLMVVGSNSSLPPYDTIQVVIDNPKAPARTTGLRVKVVGTISAVKGRTSRAVRSSRSSGAYAGTVMYAVSCVKE